MFYSIYTDGACSGNGTDESPAAYAFLIEIFNNKDDKSYVEKKDAAVKIGQGTNNIVELMGPIEALKVVPEGADVRITTDSQYVVKGMTEWIVNWKKNNWRNSQKKPVKNRELWEQLDSLCASRKVEFAWVRGHDGHEQNEHVNKLAQDLLYK